MDRALSEAQNGSFAPGYSQGRLDHLYGTGAFDGSRCIWTAYFASGSPYAAEFKDALITMRFELGIAQNDGGKSDVAGPLTQNALHEFGSDCEIVSYSLQASVTRQRELPRSAGYAARIAAELPSSDYRRMAFEARGKVAAVLLTSWPSGREALPTRTWIQAISRFFGAPSPACEQLQGQRINPRGNVVLDPYGANLECAVMKGDGWRTRHDAVQFAIEQVAAAMNIDVECEVFNRFADLFCDSEIAMIDGSGYRTRQGLVPDFFFPVLTGDCPEALAELKGITLAQSHYPRQGSTHNRSASAACEHRAGMIGAEYRRKAKNLDAKFFSTSFTPPAPGPVERRLRTFGPVLPLVFGAFADVNSQFEKLISDMAAHGAVVLWRSLMATDSSNAKGVLQWRIRRTLGMAIHRANANLVLDRLPLIGARASAHAARRARARASMFGQAGPSDTGYAYSRSRRSHASGPGF